MMPRGTPSQPNYKSLVDDALKVEIRKVTEERDEISQLFGKLRECVAAVVLDESIDDANKVTLVKICLAMSSKDDE